MSPSKARKSPAHSVERRSIWFYMILGMTAMSMQGDCSENKDEMNCKISLDHTLFSQTLCSSKTFANLLLECRHMASSHIEMLWDESGRKHLEGFVHKLRSKHKYAQKWSSVQRSRKHCWSCSGPGIHTKPPVDGSATQRFTKPCDEVAK